MHFGIAPKLFTVVSYYPVECDFFILLSCQVKKRGKLPILFFSFSIHYTQCIPNLLFLTYIYLNETIIFTFLYFNILSYLFNGYSKFRIAKSNFRLKDENCIFILYHSLVKHDLFCIHCVLRS